MRLSVHKGNNRSRKRCRDISVFLNGRDITHGCFSFDTREGWANCFVRKADGQYSIKDDRVLRACLRGQVKVINRKIHKKKVLALRLGL